MFNTILMRVGGAGKITICNCLYPCLGYVDGLSDNGTT